jgi:hypothetical protein
LRIKPETRASCGQIPPVLRVGDGSGDPHGMEDQLPCHRVEDAAEGVEQLQARCRFEVARRRSEPEAVPYVAHPLDEPDRAALGPEGDRDRAQQNAGPTEPPGW